MAQRQRARFAQLHQFARKAGHVSLFDQAFAQLRRLHRRRSGQHGFKRAVFLDQLGRGLRADAGQAGEIGEEFFNEVGGIASVETYVFSDRESASDPAVLRSLKRADGIFLAGGDQSRYVRYWRGTPVGAALDAHVRAGKPLGGTSAGLAMQGEYLYGAMDGGSVISPHALADPLGPDNTIETDFLQLALLKGVITDTHFSERNRLGRLIAFVAQQKALKQ